MALESKMAKIENSSKNSFSGHFYDLRSLGALESKIRKITNIGKTGDDIFSPGVVLIF